MSKLSLLLLLTFTAITIFGAGKSDTKPAAAPSTNQTKPATPTPTKNETTAPATESSAPPVLFAH